MRGEGREWPARVRSGGGPSAPATGLEFPSKGIRREFWNSLRREFEGNSNGAESIMRRVEQILQVSQLLLAVSQLLLLATRFCYTLMVITCYM